MCFNIYRCRLFTTATTRSYSPMPKTLMRLKSTSTRLTTPPCATSTPLLKMHLPRRRRKRAKVLLHTYSFTNVFMYHHIYIYIYTYIHKYMYAYIYIYVYVCIYDIYTNEINHATLRYLDSFVKDALAKKRSKNEQIPLSKQDR